MYRPFIVLFSLLGMMLISPLRMVSAQTDRAADKAALGTTVHFTLEANESRDIAIALPKGEYVIQADLRLVAEKVTNIQMGVDFLKSNGTLVEKRVLTANAIHRIARVAAPLRLPKPLGARLRVTNDDQPMEFWVTVYAKATRKFAPFAFFEGAIQPLGVGESAGKGGALAKEGEDGFYTFHRATLPAGKYHVSLYLKLPPKESSNLQGSIVLLDKFGVPDKSNWKLNVNEIGNETRKEKLLVLTKPTEVSFLVTSDNSSATYDYTVGIEKAEADATE